MSRSLALAAVAVLAAPGAARAAPGVDLDSVEEPAAVGHGLVYVQVAGGALHYLRHQWYYASTLTLGGELRLTPALSLEPVLPLALMERDGDVAAGWGNLGVALHHRSASPEGDARWLRAFSIYVSAPTAMSRDRPGLAARTAAELHTVLDFGEYLPDTTTARAYAALRWQGPRWSVTGRAGYRFHFYTYDIGETEYLHALVGAFELGYQLAPGPRPRWRFAAGVDTWSNALEQRFDEGDSFRHVIHLEARRNAQAWETAVQVLIPLDTAVRDDHSPMFGVSVARHLGG